MHRLWTNLRCCQYAQMELTPIFCGRHAAGNHHDGECCDKLDVWLPEGRAGGQKCVCADVSGTWFACKSDLCKCMQAGVQPLSCTHLMTRLLGMCQQAFCVLWLVALCRPPPFSTKHDSFLQVMLPADATVSYLLLQMACLPGKCSSKSAAVQHRLGPDT